MLTKIRNGLFCITFFVFPFVAVTGSTTFAGYTIFQNYKKYGHYYKIENSNKPKEK
jgi:hypothetical protein